MARDGRLTRYMMPTALALLLTVVGLTGYSMLSGSDPDPDSAKSGAAAAAPSSPVPAYEPPRDWADPERWATLPRGARSDARGKDVGFPQTLDGALGMLVASNSTLVHPGNSNKAEQLALYESYFSAADRSGRLRDGLELAGGESDARLRTDWGLPAGSELPPGSYVRAHVIGYKVIAHSPTEVSVWLLSRVTTKAGETKAERGSYTRSLAAVRWEQSDWKLSVAAFEQVSRAVQNQDEPAIVAPGDPAFSPAGWTAIREAS
ncbi:hypothetical protein GCM10010371_57440 [Streptomyces subrutilus]|uniref:DUF8175 domain-containing protein n=1 Tax=Streptomyces subrutilus TaxID=36818 RepID=A0A918VDG2_9ACTN|nr:hypothetical protein [Streptomyces subrutilus]GGZ90023.1 hypothetical protein GCM10010371_57440 [Streptomyces subrutilus]